MKTKRKSLENSEGCKSEQSGAHVSTIFKFMLCYSNVQNIITTTYVVMVLIYVTLLQFQISIQDRPTEEATISLSTHVQSIGT